MGIIKLFCILIPELSGKHWFFVFFIIGSIFRKMVPSVLSDYILKIRKKILNFKRKEEKFFMI